MEGKETTDERTSKEYDMGFGKLVFRKNGNIDFVFKNKKVKNILGMLVEDIIDCCSIAESCEDCDIKD